MAKGFEIHTKQAVFYGFVFDEKFNKISNSRRRHGLIRRRNCLNCLIHQDVYYNPRWFGRFLILLEIPFESLTPALTTEMELNIESCTANQYQRQNLLSLFTKN
jgi:hypothetical protein